MNKARNSKDEQSENTKIKLGSFSLSYLPTADSLCTNLGSMDKFRN